MKLPRKMKKAVQEAIAGRFPRRFSKQHRRFMRFCRLAGQILSAQLSAEQRDHS